MNMEKKLKKIYALLYRHFKKQHWWPADTAFEVIIGAILTQNTAWTNVEKAISNLKRTKTLSARKLFSLSETKLAELIRPSGFYNIKSKRIKSFLDVFNRKYNGSVKNMRKPELSVLRQELLEIKGIGKETADSIILYAVEKPIFVVDAYTKRLLNRYGILQNDISYDNIQRLFMDNLEKNTQMFNEYHALIVLLAKTFCRARKPICKKCPLRQSCKKIGVVL